MDNTFKITNIHSHIQSHGNQGFLLKPGLLCVFQVPCDSITRGHAKGDKQRLHVPDDLPYSACALELSPGLQHSDFMLASLLHEALTPSHRWEERVSNR